MEMGHSFSPLYIFPHRSFSLAHSVFIFCLPLRACDLLFLFFLLALKAHGRVVARYSKTATSHPFFKNSEASETNCACFLHFKSVEPWILSLWGGFKKKEKNSKALLQQWRDKIPATYQSEMRKETTKEKKGNCWRITRPTAKILQSKSRVICSMSLPRFIFHQTENNQNASWQKMFPLHFRYCEDKFLQCWWVKYGGVTFWKFE